LIWPSCKGVHMVGLQARGPARSIGAGTVGRGLRWQGACVLARGSYRPNGGAPNSRTTGPLNCGSLAAILYVPAPGDIQLTLLCASALGVQRAVQRRGAIDQSPTSSEDRWQARRSREPRPTGASSPASSKAARSHRPPHKAAPPNGTGFLSRSTAPGRPGYRAGSSPGDLHQVSEFHVRGAQAGKPLCGSLDP